VNIYGNFYFAPSEWNNFAEIFCFIICLYICPLFHIFLLFVHLFHLFDFGLAMESQCDVDVVVTPDRPRSKPRAPRAPRAPRKSKLAPISEDIMDQAKLVRLASMVPGSSAGNPIDLTSPYASPYATASPVAIPRSPALKPLPTGGKRLFSARSPASSESGVWQHSPQSSSSSSSVWIDVSSDEDSRESGDDYVEDSFCVGDVSSDSDVSDCSRDSDDVVLSVSSPLCSFERARFVGLCNNCAMIVATVPTDQFVF